MTLNPIAWVCRWLDRRRQQKIDADAYYRLHSKVASLHRWCSGEYPLLEDVTSWLLRGDARRRGYDPKPDYHITDGRSDIGDFREYLRDTYARRTYGPNGDVRYEPPRKGMQVAGGTFSPTETPTEITPPTGGSSVKRPSPTPFQFENAPQRPKPRKPKEIR